MSKENKQILPKFRFPEFKDEWKPTTIEKNCNLKGRIGYRGYTKSDLVAKGEGALVLGGKHIQNQKLDLSDPTYLNWEKYYESPEIMVEIGHIIFSQRGSLGDCALIDEEIGKATINPSMVLIKDITCDVKFLYYILIGNYIQRAVERISTNTAVPMISQKQIKEFAFFKPSPNEQQKIAACLSSLDKVITAENEKLALLKDHKKGLLQQLFPAEDDVTLSGVEGQPKFRFPEFVNDGDWEEATLDDVAKIIMGSSPKSSSYNEIKIGLPLVQGNADIKNRKSEPRIYTSEITKECEIDDILLSVRAPVGTVAKSLHNACIGRGISAIRSLNDYSQEFLYQCLLSFEPNWTNISQGGTFDSVNSSDIRGLALLIPPTKEEQQKIANCLSAADDLIAAQEHKIEQLQDHKKGLLQQLFPAIV